MSLKRKIAKAITLLYSRPRLFLMLLIERLCYRMIVRWLVPDSKLPIKRRINGVLFEFDLELDPKIKEMYFGFYEAEIIEVMRERLKQGDVFIDVGANIGYISAVGAGFVGKSGQVHSFEAVPKYFQRLEKMAMINPDYRIIVNRIALGEEEKISNIEVANIQNIGWNTMVPGYMKNDTPKETFKVPVYRLDSYLKQKSLNSIPLIKIDVEGYEFSVLKGLSKYFEDTGLRPVIICEINPVAYPLLEYTLFQFSEYMKKYNYNAYDPIDTNARIDITKLEETTDIVFISPLR